MTRQQKRSIGETRRLTVIVEQKDKEFSPSIPFETSLWLPQQFAGMNQ